MNGKLRNMTALYLLRGQEILLLHRIGSRVVGNSYTGSAGGHFEQGELNDPRACILRELREETGLRPEHLEGLTLRYIALRLKNNEVRQNYYFFARLKDPAPAFQSNEGTLHWAKLEDLAQYKMPASARFVLDHYASVGRFDEQLYGCLTTEAGGKFVPLEEF